MVLVEEEEEEEEEEESLSVDELKGEKAVSSECGHQRV